jgi:hypothetical protein
MLHEEVGTSRTKRILTVRGPGPGRRGGDRNRRWIEPTPESRKRINNKDSAINTKGGDGDLAQKLTVTVLDLGPQQPATRIMYHTAVSDHARPVQIFLGGPRRQRTTPPSPPAEDACIKKREGGWGGGALQVLFGGGFLDYRLCPVRPWPSPRARSQHGFSQSFQEPPS